MSTANSMRVLRSRRVRTALEDPRGPTTRSPSQWPNSWREETLRGHPVVLEYYRTREEYEAVAAAPGLTYTFANAVTRSAAERLVAMGIPVSFAYPGE
ncbi:MAG: hypothetical protein E7001_01395 [Coriobacteriaceae bacterium]|nr:hypothetical protein [Coriobacteriaceae bacterium]